MTFFPALPSKKTNKIYELPVDQFRPRKKILFISDHPQHPTGVGTQADMLIRGLLATGDFRFVCIGAAMKHKSYQTVAVDGNQDYVIKPCDGFGNKELLRQILLTERPDACVIFTDPKQFLWLWEVEDEIRQVCPILYWHVWDNDPAPLFNKVWYDSTDAINCLSHKTYEMTKEVMGNSAKIRYIPHAFPKNLYFEIPAGPRHELRVQGYGNRADWFIPLWVNRNAARKVPSNLLEGWAMFVKELQRKHGHKKALLHMHTNPFDVVGPNLIETAKAIGVEEANVLFTPGYTTREEVNMLHNITDCTVNVSNAEGFGLSTLISMQVGKPIIANYTGGLIRQIENHKTGERNGICIKPIFRNLIGSQPVPYIREDYCSQEQIAQAFMEMYELGAEGREALGQKAKAYAKEEFGYEKMIADWRDSLHETISHFELQGPRRFELIKLDHIEEQAQLPPRSEVCDKTVVQG